MGLGLLGREMSDEGIEARNGRRGEKRRIGTQVERKLSSV